MSRSSEEETVLMKNPAQRLIAEVPRRQARVEMTIGIDLVMFGAITALSTRAAR